MSIRDDERAQTVQVGAILLLGTLVVALSVYQVTSVPGQNADTEFTHNQGVQEQLQEVRSTILETVATGQGRSATVTLGTQYRDRIVAVNPAPPSGTLETADLGNLTVRNATAAGRGGTAIETRDFWNGSERQYAATALTYEPNYNEYREAPTTVYEHTVLANRFEAANGTDLLLSNGTLIDGREITLVALDGSLSATGSEAVPVDTRPISVSDTVVPIESSGGPITLTLPTTLSESRWEDLVDGKFASVESYDSAASPSEVTIRFEQGETYRLRMAKIGVGSGAPATSAAYLTTVSGSTEPLAENESRELRVEVRDRYNNPIQGETVNFTIVKRNGSQPGTLAPGTEPKDATITTDEQGRASVTYRAPRDISTSTSPVQVRIVANRTGKPEPAGSLDPKSLNTVRFDFNVTNTDGSRGTYDIEWNRTALDVRSGVEPNPAGYTYNRSAGTLDIPIRTAPVTPDVPLSVESTDRTVATVSAVDRTGSNGTAPARIDVSNPGTVTLAATSGNSTDELSLTVENRPPNASVEFSPESPRTDELVGFDANASDPDGRAGALTYEWAFGDGSRGYGPTPQHAYEEAGTYDVTLTVADAYGANTSVNRTVTVSNRAPEAAIEYDPLSPEAGERVAFSGARSSDPDGEITGYEWDFGDGSTGSGPTPRHTYREAGTYTVSLAVTDDDGTETTVRTNVTVDEREPPPDREPTAAFEYAPLEPRTNERVRFDASGSDDPDGTIAAYEWELTYRNDRTATAAGETVTANPLPPGRSRMRLTVTDDDGNTDEVVRTITVRRGSDDRDDEDEDDDRDDEDEDD